jgi:hypothetical protein
VGIEPIVVMPLERSVWSTNIDVEKWNSERENSQVIGGVAFVCNSCWGKVMF